jgi:hypothetical protein
MQEIVPGWLAAACPALHSLRLAVCTVRAGEDVQSQQQQQLGEVVAAFPSQLQSLCLRWGTVEPLQQLLAPTLAALPSLTSLDVTLRCSLTDSGVDMSSMLSALAGQLTQLVWFHEYVFLHEEPSLPSLLTSPAILCKLGKLQWLDMMGITLDDAGLRVLLENLPTLTHVGVRKFVLHESHADVGCRWEDLSMIAVSTTCLAHLPLRGIKRVCVSQVMSTAAAAGGGGAAAASHTAAAAQLTAALSATSPDCTWATCYDKFTLRCKVAEMPLLLPLLARWTGIEVFKLITPEGECLTPAAVGALRALLKGMPSCTELSIGGLTPHPSIQLLPVLARTNVSTVVLVHTHMTEAQLMLWCSGGQARRPITVELQEACRFSGIISQVHDALDVPGSGVELQEWVDQGSGSDYE